MSRYPRVLALLGAVAILPTLIGCSGKDAGDAPAPAHMASAPPTKDAGTANNTVPLNSGAPLPPPPGWKKP